MTIDAIRRDYRRGSQENKTAGAVTAGLDPARTEFLHALARAARQFRTYPAHSPLCVEAVDACHRAFGACDITVPLLVRITPTDLIVDDIHVGHGTAIEHELARPLHRARVASIEIDRAASPRDWLRLCVDLFRLHRIGDGKTTLAELLAEAGVAAIQVRTAPHPEVVDIGAPPIPVRSLVERERARQATATPGGPAQYFYPPGKGWVRLDPTVEFDSISLVDLAVLVDEPAELASILMRLTDDDRDPAETAAAAVEEKYADVVRVLSALDPRLARVLFAKLARAVLQLDPERRRTLLRRAILPGLLDGRADAEAVLTDFPDVDLADALCLLLDLETAAPEVLSTALNRLALPAERRALLTPILEGKLASKKALGTDHRPLQSYADALIRVASDGSKSFAEFAAFDLSLDDGARAMLDSVCASIRSTDADTARLTCLANLARVEPAPSVVAGFVDDAVLIVRKLVREQRWSDVATWTGRFAAAAAHIAGARPDTAEVIRNGLARIADRAVVVGVATLRDGSIAERQHADTILAALGSSIAAPWLAALDDPAEHARVRALLPAICDRAKEFGPVLAPQLARCGPAAARAIVTALGFARGRYESVLAGLLTRGDEGLGREVIRSLGRIGSGDAATIIAAQLEHGPAWARSAAEEALWRFPQATAVAVARDLLGRRSFVLREPELAGRLLDRAAALAAVDLGPVLDRLQPLRFRFWNPALVRIAARARELR